MAVTKSAPVAPEKRWIPEFTSEASVLRSTVPARTAKEGYYGIPLLKRPTWGWEVAWYFFLGGISSGSFVLASLAQLTGKRGLRPLVRTGYTTAFVTFLPCPPLLIADLGDPSRFHHMLRVFKPGSPMNLGTWALTTYSLPLTLLAGSRAAAALPWPVGRRLGARLEERGPARLLSLLGLPPALTMLSYPGVLLSTTSTPLWSESRCLGALMACSSFAAAVSANSLALALSGDRRRESRRRLEALEKVAQLGETIALGSYLVTSRRTLKPLLKGRRGWQFWLGAVGAGLVLPALVRSKEAGRSRRKTILHSALSLAGGLALKWVLTQAGRDSAQDAEICREATRPNRSATGWQPG